MKLSGRGKYRPVTDNKENHEKSVCYRELDDQKLAKLAQSGDDSAMEMILLKYKKLVKSKTTKLYITGADFEDIIQEGMIGLFKAVRTYNSEKRVPFSSFANYCISSQITDAIRGASRKKHKVLNCSVSLDGIMKNEKGEEFNLLDVYADLSKPGPYEQVISKEENESLKRFIEEKLTDNEREAVVLLMSGYTYPQIAKKLGRTEKSVERAVSRARKKHGKSQLAEN